MATVLGKLVKKITPVKKEEPKKEEEKNPLTKGISTEDTIGAPYKLIIDAPGSTVEPNYLWIARQMQTHGHFGLEMSGNTGKLLKLKDIYRTGELSEFWQLTEQRRGLQQDKVMQFMQSIGTMVKTLFQMVREIRLLKERLTYYNQSYGKDYEQAKNAEIALKSIWTDLVEGGIKSPGSVFGLGQTVGFTILPDLFFDAFPRDKKEITKILISLKKEGMNKAVRQVLTRKLEQFMTWKDATYKELTTRERFMLAYLAQHFSVIKMYLAWSRPYLRNIKRLQLEENTFDVDITKAFNTSKIELELLGYNTSYTETTPEGWQQSKNYQKFFPCVVVRMHFTAIPEMSYGREGQRTPSHTGRSIIYIEHYALTQEQIDEYIKKVDAEDLELLSTVNEAMDAMKEEIDKYLKEAKEQRETKEEPKPPEVKHESIFEPFKAVFSGFRETFGAFKKPKSISGKPTLTSKQEKAEEKKANNEAVSKAFTLYDTFKKAHKMMTP